MPQSQPVAIERIVLVHAMKSTLASHWYETFLAKLRPVAEVVAPAMPTPDTPHAAEWQATLRREVGSVDARTLLIAHSVGNAAALQFLTSLPAGWRLGGLVDVAGFAEPQPGNDATIPFVQDIDTALVRESTAHRHTFLGTDDPEVPNALSERLAARLASTVHAVDGAGHFRDEDGYTAFPQLESLALGLVSPRPAS